MRITRRVTVDGVCTKRVPLQEDPLFQLVQRIKRASAIRIRRHPQFMEIDYRRLVFYGDLQVHDDIGLDYYGDLEETVACNRCEMVNRLLADFGEWGQGTPSPMRKMSPKRASSVENRNPN